MNKPKKTQKQVSMDSLKELGRKYGVKVTDMTERRVQAIGIIGGVRRNSQKQEAVNP
jgi:hypothetical protein